MRQPLEDKVVTISRAQATLTFPASFMLVAAVNPCPCGYYGDAAREGTCSLSTARRYQRGIRCGRLATVFGPIWVGFAFDLNYNLPYLSGAVIMVIGFLISLVWVVQERSEVRTASSSAGRSTWPT